MILVHSDTSNTEVEFFTPGPYLSRLNNSAAGVTLYPLEDLSRSFNTFASKTLMFQLPKFPLSRMNDQHYHRQTFT